MSLFPARILLATDGSEEATLAAETTADLVAKTGSELHVVYVGSGESPGGHVAVQAYDPLTEAEVQEERKQAKEKVLEEQVGYIEDSGGTVAESHLRTGRADTETVRLGEELGAGLIVVGSRGLGGMRRALVGSVSDSVVRHAHCPVLVVRAQTQSQD